jgi:hypothetical protein
MSTNQPHTDDGGLQTAENSVTGPMSGVQAGVINGGVRNEIHSNTVLPRPPLKVQRATATELQHVRTSFISPGEFAAASRLLAGEPAIVLHNAGTGRLHTARRLLLNHGVAAIVELNPGRTLDTLQRDDLQADEGYVWNLSGPGSTPFTAWEWHYACDLLVSAGTKLVVIVDSPAQIPPEVQQLVGLTAPDAVEVAAATLRSGDGPVEEAIRIVKNDLADALGPGTSPTKAVWAAVLAKETACSHRDLASARANLTDGVERAVASVCQDLATIDYAMLLAVAVLENQPYDEVAKTATTLDLQIRTAELPKDKELRPRRIFATAKNALLDAVNATVELREHPEHVGLFEETVRFSRSDWGDAALRQVWSQFHVLHSIVLDWMGRDDMYRQFGNQCSLALSRLITEVPAHAPLSITDQLARSTTVAKRRLASDTLARIAGLSDHRHLVEAQLDRWIRDGTDKQRWTAAHLYGTRYSTGQVPLALRQLEKIVRTGGKTARDGALVATVQLIARREDRGQVLPQVLRWCQTHDNIGGAANLRWVGLEIALSICGLIPPDDDELVKPRELAAAFPELISDLTMLVLHDRKMGSVAIDSLENLCQVIRIESLTSRKRARPFEAELLRLIRIVTPDLRWWHRRSVVMSLIRRHPTRRRSINHIFRTAARLSRQSRVRTVGDTRDGSDGTSALSVGAGEPGGDALLSHVAEQ